MATRSTIAVVNEQGDVFMVYCHWDGYLEFNGRLLLDFHNSLDSAAKLVSLGDLSVLAPRIEPIGEHSFDNPEEGTCIYYGRDRGELDTGPKQFWNLEMYRLAGEFEEYNYIFKDNDWYLYNLNKKSFALVRELM
jgi:hypothetical protein